MNLQDCIKKGILNELATFFQEEARANLLLEMVGFPAPMRPIFPTSGNGTILGYWSDVCNQIQGGVLPEGTDIQLLVNQASELLPANELFQEHGSSSPSSNAVTTSSILQSRTAWSKLLCIFSSFKNKAYLLFIIINKSSF